MATDSAGLKEWVTHLEKKQIWKGGKIQYVDAWMFHNLVHMDQTRDRWLFTESSIFLVAQLAFILMYLRLSKSALVYC